MSAFRTIGRIAVCAAAFTFATPSVSSAHARPGQIPGLISFLPFADTPLSLQQKLTRLEDKINALAEGRIKLSLREGVSLLDVGLLRDAVMNSMPSGSLKTNMLVALSSPAGVALVSAHLFYANALNESLADGWADPGNFRVETPKPQPTVQTQPEAGSKPSQKPQKLTDSGRLSDAQPTPAQEAATDPRLQKHLAAEAAKGQSPSAKPKEYIVTFRGVKLKVDEAFSPKDKSGVDIVERKILWMIDLQPGDLRDFVAVLSPEELRVFDSVIRAMANNREYSALTKSDVFEQIRTAISGALGKPEQSPSSEQKCESNCHEQ